MGLNLGTKKYGWVTILILIDGFLQYGEISEADFATESQSLF